MAALITYLVCGCRTDAHTPGCALDLAEQIAHEAADVALDQGAHRLVTVLVALHEAGLLRDLDGDDPTETLEDFLDYLWDNELLGPAGPQSTIDQASAPMVAKTDIDIPSACLVDPPVSAGVTS